MAGVRHLWFFLNWFFGHFLGFGGSICISLPNFVKIGQTVAERSQFIHFFKMMAVRHFGFVGQILGQPTTKIWSLLLCKILWWVYGCYRDVPSVYPRKPNALGLALNGSTRKKRIRIYSAKISQPNSSSNKRNEPTRRARSLLIYTFHRVAGSRHPATSTR